MRNSYIIYFNLKDWNIKNKLNVYKYTNCSERKINKCLNLLIKKHVNYTVHFLG